MPAADLSRSYWIEFFDGWDIIGGPPDDYEESIELPTPTSGRSPDQ